MTGHAVEAIQEVARAEDGQRTYFCGCSCGAWPCGVFRACPRPLDGGHSHRGVGDLCWALVENPDGTATFSPSVDLSGGQHPHFHTEGPFTVRLTEGRDL